MKNDNYPTTNRVGDPPLSRQASHSIYSILEYEDHQNPNLPVNPNSLRYTDIGMNKRYKQSLYISRSGRMLSRETKSNLLIFYIFLTCWLIISFATWILLYNQQNSNDDHLMVRLIFLGGILVASYATIYMLWKHQKFAIYTDYIYSALGLIIMIYLVITDERVLSGITGNTYNSSNQSHVMVIICFIVLIRLVTNENFLTLAIISFITLILLLALFIALSPLSVFATLSDFFILVVFLVIQIIESHKSEYRAKQLFWRKTKEEDACSPSSSLMDDEKKKESSQVNTEIELLVESCDKIKQYIKTATAVIMFKDVKAKLKLAQNEVEKIKRKIAHSTIRDKFKLDFGEELDEQDKEFVRTHYMNSNVNQELRASIRRMTLNDIFEKNKVFPASEFGLKELDGVLSTIGKDWNFDIMYIYQSTGKSLSILGKYLFEKWTFNEIYSISNETISSFFDALENAYNNSNPYHNACHAADTLHSMLYFFNYGELIKTVSTLDGISSILAALGHDTGHPALTNRYLIINKDPIAICYNDNSVLENMHSARLFEIMFMKGNNILEKLDLEDWNKARKLIIEMILDTDMSRHFEIIGRFKARSENLGDLSFDNSEDKLSILAMALKVADLGHAAKSTDLHDKWTNLVMEEYFRQGDLEKEMKLPVSIYCDRMTTDIPRCQAGFLKIVCIPMFDIWCSFIKSEQLRSTLMPQLRKNLRFWEEKGKFRSSMIYTDAKIKEVIETSKMSLEFFTEDPIMSSPGL